MNTEEKGLVSIQEVKADDIDYIEIIEEDDTSAKQRIRKAMTDQAYVEWYTSLEEYAAQKLFEWMNKEWGMWRSEDILLKYLRFMAESQWWTSWTKEFTVKSNIPVLNRKSLFTA